jgi:hypothetical protein
VVTRHAYLHFGLNIPGRLGEGGEYSAGRRMTDRTGDFRGPTAGMPTKRWQYDINPEKTVAWADWQVQE